MKFIPTLSSHSPRRPFTPRELRCKPNFSLPLRYEWRLKVVSPQPSSYPSRIKELEIFKFTTTVLNCCWLLADGASWLLCAYHLSLSLFLSGEKKKKKKESTSKNFFLERPLLSVYHWCLSLSLFVVYTVVRSRKFVCCRERESCSVCAS